MERTLHYFNCFITLNGEKTTIPFSRLIDEVFLLDEDIKYREIKTGAYSLVKMKFVDENLLDVNDRLICFANYRNKKPFLGNRRSDRLDEINDDVVESTTCFFQHSNRLMVFEYNHFGARPKHIERYLSSFLPKEENAYWDVEIIEIEPSIGITDIRNTNNVKYIEFKLDLSSHQRGQILRQNVPESITANLFAQAVEAQSQIGGNVAKIIFGNGRKGNNHLDALQIVELLNTLDLESDLYESIRVKYYSHQLHKQNELDLKNAGVLKKKIEIDGDAWGVTGDTIEQDFYERGRTGENNHRRFDEELIVINELPVLINPVQTNPEPANSEAAI
ncbi:DUF6731 family protein [Peribacillus frigoritolerans]